MLPLSISQFWNYIWAIYIRIRDNIVYYIFNLFNRKKKCFPFPSIINPTPLSHYIFHVPYRYNLHSLKYMILIYYYTRRKSIIPFLKYSQRLVPFGKYFYFYFLVNICVSNILSNKIYRRTVRTHHIIRYLYDIAKRSQHEAGT